LRRLYFEEDVRVFESEPVAFRCKCSRERVANMLRSLGEDEVLDILRAEGGVHVKCEFCNQGYDFDEVDVAQLFVPETSPETPPTLH
jgi:molecular chaperone Hsp33